MHLLGRSGNHVLSGQQKRHTSSTQKERERDSGGFIVLAVSYSGITAVELNIVYIRRGCGASD